jgi:hypothetical protein
MRSSKLPLRAASCALLACGVFIGASAADAGQRRALAPMLSGVLYDPLGGPVADAQLYLEQRDGPEIQKARTDEHGAFAFERVPPGTYALTSPLDFVPAATIEIGTDPLRHDVRMEITPVTGVVTICLDCPRRPDPPDSLLQELEQDREAAKHEAVQGAEPVEGWARWELRVPAGLAISSEIALRRPIVVEGVIGADGIVRQLRVEPPAFTDSAKLAMAAVETQRWTAARVRGVPVSVPLRFTIDFTRQSRVPSVPAFGHKKLDAIKGEDVQRL